MDASDCTAAIEQAAALKPDLVFMDLRLPGAVDGFEATRRLRRSERGAAMKIVAVSASAYDVDRSECFIAGCDEFLAKPFREEELWASAQRLLDVSWNYGDVDDTRLPFALAIQPPPAGEAAALYELAAKGDVVAIRARAQALLALDRKYAPFAQSVLDLAGRFKMKAIRQFVGRYLK
jgi:CheY-like chemotaxis protein